MASTIAQTTPNDVLNAVQDGVDAGEGNDAIARRIGNVTGFSPYRSMTVARTETHAAALFGQIESGRQAERDYGITLEKEWLPTLDNRTCDTHAEMTSYGAIPLADKFIVGGYEMDRPGDPAGGAEEVINCRCTCVSPRRRRTINHFGARPRLRIAHYDCNETNSRRRASLSSTRKSMTAWKRGSCNSSGNFIAGCHRPFVSL